MNIDHFETCIRTVPAGGVTSPKGFKAAGIHAGFRKNPQRLDMACVTADKLALVRIHHQSLLRGARAGEPPELRRCGKGLRLVKGIVINSGNANAATGEQGRAVAAETCEIASQILGCEREQVLVASTGVIVTLGIELFETGLPAAIDALSVSGGADAARAIMTTDTHSKEYAISYTSQTLQYADCTFTVGGMCKGSGMIMPNMATMIAVITTDAPVEPRVLHSILKQTVDVTFNKVTVDSDSSTNDTCIMLASGAAGADAAPIEEGSDAYNELLYAVHEVCETLARTIASDGEGASRLVTVNVTGAATDEDADTAARAVANSPLVKTAIAGHDCNWGRIAMALGKCGVVFNQEDVSIDIMGMLVCRGGLTVAFDEDEALRRFEAPEIVISCDLGAGEHTTTAWTCDLTHDYVTINGDYRT